MQQLQHHFYSHVTQLKNSIKGSQSFLAFLSGHTTDRESRVYTYAIGLLRQAGIVVVEDGSPTSCGQTATVTTAL